jgi:hypothetical protein
MKNRTTSTTKVLAAAVLAIPVFAGVAIFALPRMQKMSNPSPATPQEIYRGLRNLALQSSRAKLRLPPAASATTPWGAIMDWGVTNGTATVFALSNGEASIYLSSGGGFLGGAFSHESIRTAGKRMVAAAAECQPQAQLTESFPLPERGHVNFYLLTDSGIFSASASEEELKSHRSPLSRIGDAAQDIITEYRRIKP